MSKEYSMIVVGSQIELAQIPVAREAYEFWVDIEQKEMSPYLLNQTLSFEVPPEADFLPNTDFRHAERYAESDFSDSEYEENTRKKNGRFPDLGAGDSEIAIRSANGQEQSVDFYADEVLSDEVEEWYDCFLPPGWYAEVVAFCRGTISYTVTLPEDVDFEVGNVLFRTVDWNGQSLLVEVAYCIDDENTVLAAVELIDSTYSIRSCKFFESNGSDDYQTRNGYPYTVNELQNCSTTEDYVGFLSSILKVFLRDDYEKITFWDHGDADDRETGESFGLRRVAGSYELGVYAFLQRIMYYKGVLERIFTPEQWKNALECKEDWQIYLEYGA